MKLSRRHALGLFGAGLTSLHMNADAQTAPGVPHAVEPQGISIPTGVFKGSRKSLAAYEVPVWFRDAKFGIWSHWGPQSAIEAGDWYARNMYLQGMKQYNYHVQHYGHPSKFGYKDTIPAWKAELFNPAALMKLYKTAGAKYFMSMGCHHDNFDMWNSKWNRWNAAKMGPKQDIVGAWREAARAEGLRFGVSEHLWLAYKWLSVSHGTDLEGPLANVPYDGADQKLSGLYIESDQVWRTLDWNEDGIPDWWKKHWYMRMRDLLDSYQPDFLYSDGPLPFQDYGLSVVAHLYNLSAKRSGGEVEGVYFSKRDQDSAIGTCVLDRERGVLTDISPRPWQTDTCIGDWHYLRGMEYKSPKTIIDLLVDIVSRNGNLMLNFPLPASGMLDAEELVILKELGDWMAVNGEGIFGTRPWTVAGEGAPVILPTEPVVKFNERNRRSMTASDIRFTTKGSDLYAFVMGWPDYALEIQTLGTDSPQRIGKISRVELVGGTKEITWKQTGKALRIVLPAQTAPTPYASLFRIHGALA